MQVNIKVVIVGGNDYERKTISDIISNINDIKIVGETDTAEKGMRMIGELKPDVIITGGYIEGFDVFHFSESVAAQYPLHQIIMVSNSAEEEIYLKAMRAGIKEILKLPLEQTHLSEAIYRTFDFKEKRRINITQAETKLEIPEKKAKVISVFSTKGGVGKTTISSNLAVLLKQVSRRVALLDLDIYSGDIALAMDIVPKRNICDLISDIGRLDVDLLESYMFRHSSGVMVLPAPMKMEYANFLTAEHISKILKILVKEYDYIVIDCASYLHDPVLAGLNASDIVLLLTTMDIFSIKNLKSCVSFLESMNFRRGKFRLVVNRAFREAGIVQKDIEATIGLPVAAMLPQEEQIIIKSVNQGEPAVLSYKKSRFSRGMSELVKKL